MRTEIKTWGNSKAIRLPKDVMTKYGLMEGDAFDIDMSNINLVLIPVRKKKMPRKSLRQLLSEMDNQLPVLSEWENMPRSGEEML